MPTEKTVNGPFWPRFRLPRVGLVRGLRRVFGIEVTIDDMAALFLPISFHLGLFWAGLAASCLGMMNIFARAVGGILGTPLWPVMGAAAGGVLWLLFVLFVEGLALMLFSQKCAVLWRRFPAFLVFGILVEWLRARPIRSCRSSTRRHSGQSRAWSERATPAPLPPGFLFKTAPGFWPTALSMFGAAVSACSLPVLALLFAPA